MKLHGRSRDRGSGFLRWVERLLVIAGAAMLGWCVLIVVDASVSQRVARRSLVPPPPSAAPPDPGVPNETRGVPVRAPILIRGSAVAELSIPRVHLSAVVLHGSDAQTLRRGPGHLENTALPGESGNAVIAGHRDSFFRPLRNIEVGDDIFVDTPLARFHYRVTSLRVVKPHDLSVLNPTDAAVLTLITCYPFWVLGNAPDRFVVRAVGVVDSTSAPFTVAASRPLEPIPAPVVQRRAVSEPAAPNPRRILDDETLVRQAIERFRLAYNARIARDNGVPDGRLVRFQACDVSTTDDRATATCDASSQSTDERARHVWNVTLERAHDAWAIRSVEVQ